MNAKIADVFAREILDSRGNPTIEAVVRTEDGSEAKRQHHQAHRQAAAKLWSYVMEIPSDIRARVLKKLSRSSTAKFAQRCKELMVVISLTLMPGF